jgi:hypothetical protein
MPNLAVGDTLQFKLVCRFITSDGRVGPHDIVKSIQRLPRKAFSNDVQWVENKNAVRVGLPDLVQPAQRRINKPAHSITKVELMGKFKIQDAESGTGMSQLFDYIQSWSNDLESSMKLSLRVRTPPQEKPPENLFGADVESEAAETVESVDAPSPALPSRRSVSPTRIDRRTTYPSPVGRRTSSPRRDVAEAIETPLEVRKRRRRPIKPESPTLKLLGRRAVYPALPADVEERAEVKASDIPGAGKGLFAKYNFRKGTTVAEIKEPILISQADASAAIRKGLPDDAFFHLDKMKGLLKSQRNKSFLADGSFDPRHPPKWYRLNHGASSANTVFGYDEAARKATWVAKQNIPAGSELYFNYNPGEKTSF